MRSKHPIQAAVSGMTVSNVDAGCVSKVMIESDVRAWLTSRPFDPRTLACIAYVTKVKTGARMAGVYPVGQ